MIRPNRQYQTNLPVALKRIFSSCFLLLAFASTPAMVQGSTDNQHGIVLDNFAPVGNWLYEDGGENFPDRFDPVLFVEPDWEYPYWMYVGGGRDQAQELWKSQDMVNWTIEVDDMRDTDGNLISVERGTNFNWGRKGPDGKYYLYQSYRDQETRLYRGDTMAQLQFMGTVLNESDPGGFYDSTTGMWHMYFEANPVSGQPSGDALGHATSPDGINWTVSKNSDGSRKLVLDVSDRPWHTGDPDIIRIGDTYHMFIDNAVDHPDYRIAWATSDSPDGPFTVQEDAVTHWTGGDATVRYIEEQDTFYMYQEFRGDGENNIGVGFATAPASGVDSVAPIDPTQISGMKLWLKDAERQFSAGDAGAFDAVWTDSSGQGNHLTSFAGRANSSTNPVNDITPADTDPTLIAVTDPTTGRTFHAVQFADEANELMKADLLGVGGDDGGVEGSLSDLTIFAVYRLTADALHRDVRPLGMGSFRDTSSETAIGDFFNLAGDSSIRRDNGSIHESDEELPADEFFIRISRMDSASDIDEWLHVIDGVGLDLLQTRGVPFTTADDDFFIGDIRVDGDALTGDTFAIAELLVFDSALTDADIRGIDAYLAQKYAIPEPSSMALLGLGGLLLARRRVAGELVAAGG